MVLFYFITIKLTLSYPVFNPAFCAQSNSVMSLLNGLLDEQLLNFVLASKPITSEFVLTPVNIAVAHAALSPTIVLAVNVFGKKQQYFNVNKLKEMNIL